MQRRLIPLALAGLVASVTATAPAAPVEAAGRRGERAPEVPADVLARLAAVERAYVVQGRQLTQTQQEVATLLQRLVALERRLAGQ